jgi:phosphotransferase system  glucose/maltose/N-acetylglucosamine-specific IIC component
MTNLLAHVNDFNQPGQEPGWGMMGRPAMMGWWPMMSGGWFGSLFNLLIGILILLVVVALFRWLWQKGNLEKKGRK